MTNYRIADVDHYALAKEQWDRTVALAEQCGLTLSVNLNIPRRWESSYLGDVGYSPGRKTVFLTESNEILCHAMHEVCHWLVASPQERRRINWGFEAPPFTPGEKEELACDVTVGIAELWGYPSEARALYRQLNQFEYNDSNIQDCTDLAKEYLENNGIDLG